MRVSSICSFRTLLVKNNIDISNIVMANGAPTEDQLPNVIVLAKRSFTISAYIRLGGDAMRVVTLPIEEENAIPSKSITLNFALNLIPFSDNEDNTANAIGITKIATVVLMITVEIRAVQIIKPTIILLGEYPKMLIMAKAIFRCKPDFSSARTTRNIPKRRIIIGDIYSAPTALRDSMPVMGNSAKGNKEVA
jgi:hypothetical protein